jgi:hypothetical protein
MPEHSLLFDSNGAKLLSTLDPGCEKCLLSCKVASELTSNCGKNELRRRGMINEDLLGSAYLCSPLDDDIKSSKRFKKSLLNLHGLLPMAIDVRNAAQDIGKKNASRIIHNLRTLSGRISLEIYSIVSQEALSADPSSQRSVLAQAIEKDAQESSEVLLRLLKNSQAMANEFSVFERLDRALTNDIKPQWHKIHKIVKNSVSLFYQDLQKNSLKLNLLKCNHEVLVDYETFSAGLYYVLENATKYAAHATDMSLSFDNGSAAGYLTLRLTMISLTVEEHEAERIFDEGYSGVVAKKRRLNGDGLGMFLAKQLLILNDLSIKFLAGNPTRNALPEISYAKNAIEIMFKPELNRLPNMQMLSK